MGNKNSSISKLLPMMFAFFAMGFVDMVGTATNYVKADFDLSDTMANFLPSMVFLWFFFLSVPTSLLMNKIGKKKTVLASLIVTVLALACPLVGYSYPILVISFCLLGIGNTLMQVSLNPLISCVVNGDRLASTLTFGQLRLSPLSLHLSLPAGQLSSITTGQSFTGDSWQWQSSQQHTYGQ